jgi:outer membrane receptor protein involved in Fe transport
LFGRYVGDVFDTSTRADGDTADPGKPLPVDEYVTVSLYGDYRLEGGFAEGTRIRVGVRNIFDEQAPTTDEQLGYFGSLHSNRGRYAYLDIRKQF